MDRLKHETAELHAVAERQPLQAAMVSGRVSREAFVAFLAQIIHVHAGLEGLIRQHRDACSRLRVVGEEQLRHSSRIAEDLLALGGSMPEAPGAATRRLIDQLQRSATEAPMSLLGAHYVLEGSMNGNRYIAKAVRRALGLEGCTGTRYLDPYGDAQREVWQRHRAEIDRLDWAEHEADAAVRSAKAMFQGIVEISGDVAPTPG